MPRPGKLFGVVVLAGLAILLTARTAEADDKHYEALIARAVQAYRAGTFEEAYGHFEKAHAENPNARTHRGLGISAFRLEQPALAVFHLRSALLDERHPLDEPLRASVRELLAAAETRVARLDVNYGPGTNVLIDDELPLVDPENRDLLVSPGHHRLTVTLAEGERVFQEFEVSAGARLQLDIDGARLEAPEPNPPPRKPLATISPRPIPRLAPPSEQTRPAESQRLPIVPLALASTGGILLIGATVTGVLTLSEKNALEEGCNRNDRCYAEYSNHQRRGRQLQGWTNGLLIAGGSAVAGGVVWWILTRNSERRSPTPMVSLGESHCVFRLEGSL